MIYPIVLYGDPVLRQPTEEIPQGTDLKELTRAMSETREHAQGVGLAAPYIGKSIRLFVVDGTGLEDEPGMEGFRKAFINPVLLEEQGDDWEFEEGCLSIPNIREPVSRKEKLRIRYYEDRKSTRLNSSHVKISYAGF